MNEACADYVYRSLAGLFMPVDACLSVDYLRVPKERPSKELFSRQACIMSASKLASYRGHLYYIWVLALFQLIGIIKHQD